MDKLGLAGLLMIDIFLFGVLCGAKIMYYKMMEEKCRIDKQGVRK